MAAELLATLEEFERMVENGKISMFTISFRGDGLLQVKPDNLPGADKEIELTEEVVQTMDIFFSGIDSIAYRSYDYTSLKSLIHARVMLDNMLQKPPETKGNEQLPQLNERKRLF